MLPATTVALPGSSRSRRPAATHAGTFSLAVVLAVLACADPVTSPTSPGETPSAPFGSLSGTVTLLGTDGPPNPAGVRIGLYASDEDFEVRRAAYTATLRRIEGPVRRYAYEFPIVARGEYYVIACFDFGCGGHRNPTTGEHLRVSVERARTRVLNFGI